MNQKLQTYNRFPDYYDEIIRGNWYDIDSEVLFLDETMQKFWSWKEILEFACGTWTIAKELIKKWYTVTWVDLSEQMINKAWEWDFQVWDMTSINLNREFDIVLCTYNSVCHLKDLEAWKDFFQNAYKHLNKDWILIFDILTLFEFENISRDFKWFFNVRWDTLCLEMFKQWDEDIFKWLIKMFVSSWKNNFELVEEEIREISFSIEKIKKELEWVWFEIQHLEDFHFGEVTAESERVYFVAKK